MIIKKRKRKDIKMPNWIIYSFLAMASITIMTLLFKELTTGKISVISINFYFFLFTTFGFFCIMLISKTTFQLSTHQLFLLILLAFVALSYNHFEILALKNSPNPGFVEALTSFRIVAITLLSFILFGAGITVQNFTGILFVMIGIYLICI